MIYLGKDWILLSDLFVEIWSSIPLNSRVAKLQLHLPAGMASRPCSSFATLQSLDALREMPRTPCLSHRISSCLPLANRKCSTRLDFEQSDWFWMHIHIIYNHIHTCAHMHHKCHCQPLFLAMMVLRVFHCRWRPSGKDVPQSSPASHQFNQKDPNFKPSPYMSLPCLGKERLAVVLWKWHDGVEQVKCHAIQSILDAKALHQLSRFCHVCNVLQDISELSWNKRLLICEAMSSWEFHLPAAAPWLCA